MLPLLGEAQVNPSSFIADGDRQLNAGRYDAALKSYARAQLLGADFTHDPVHARALGRCYLAGARPEYDQAGRWLKQSLALDPSNDNTRSLLATALVRAEDYREAAAVYGALIDAHPDDPEFILARERALRQAGEVNDARDAMRIWLERNPHIVSVRVEYALLLAYQRQLDDSRQQFQMALNYEPANTAALVGMAKVTSWQGDQASALKQYDRLLSLHPGLYDAVVGKAFSLLWMGRRDDARPLLLSASRQHPADEDVREALRSMGITPPAVQAKQSEPAPPRKTSVPRESSAPTPSTDTPAQAAVLPTKVTPPTSIAASGAPWWQRLDWRSLSAVAGLLGAAIWFAALVVSQRARARRRVRLQQLAQRPLESDSPEPIAGEPEPSAIEKANEAEPKQIATAGELVSIALPRIDPRPATRLAGSLRGIKVVVVGANEVVVAVETRLLQAAAASVSTFDAWQPALHFADSTPPDLLVLNPSTSDGWTAMTAFAWLLVNRPELRSRTLLTLSVRDSDTESFCSQYASHYLFHPFDPAEFFTAVQRTLASEKAMRAASGI